MSAEEDRARYRRAAHAVQSGVATEMNYDPKPTSPKHLRTGVNLAMSDHSGLAKLLIEKGVFTEAEYFAAIADAAEREQHDYEERLSKMIGGQITLA